jgi:hypothetical protein
MENPEQAIEILDWLKGLGAGIALDEFGAGYSSLAYLHRLAVDTIKIDRSLISHGSDNKSGAVVLRSALAMARELGKDVVAVGMEREEDVAYVRALGVDYAQGFYFGEPMTEREAMNLINALAKSSKRDEKREKKKEKAEASKMVSEAPEAPPIERTASRPTLPPNAPASAQGTSYQLPVPISQNSVKPRQKTGLFTSLRRGIGGVSSSVAGVAGRALSVFKPRKKAPAAARPKPTPQRPGSVATPRDAQSLRGRLANVDPAQAEAAPRPPASAGAMRPSAAPRQPPPVPPQQPPHPHPMQPAHLADPAPDEDPVPDFLRSDGTQGRRRRG